MLVFGLLNLVAVCLMWLCFVRVGSILVLMSLRFATC